LRNRKIEYTINEKGCHICTSHKVNKDGYSRMKLKGKSVLIHRYIYKQNYGEIPDGMVVRHKCDVRNCITPLHLEIGTHQDNMNDMVNRGRAASHKGESNPRAKLKESDVIDIRSSKVSSYKICKQYGVSPSTIRMIREYRRWNHVA